MCVHKIMNMYIHGMYMVQTCMYRFVHLCGGGRIPDAVHTVFEQYVLGTYKGKIVRTWYVLGVKSTYRYRAVQSSTRWYSTIAWYIPVHTGTYQVHTDGSRFQMIT